ncbi:acetyl-CoA carboxylase biotin carboxyl carrier protein [Fontivita pretiosa]|uniref:acetyl-CoA carboxylase biotin carboxyl carrier protein n=1 Tax=Fontivita pretiosa TaxID=2989684 RepID=UPI003D171732
MKKKRSGKQTRGETAPPAGELAGGGPMDVTLLEQIVKLMSANDLNRIELRDGKRRIVLRRGGPLSAGAAAGMFPQSPYVAPPAAHSTLPPPAAGAAAGSTSPPVDETAGLIPIKSPMVGTFYAAPSPDAKPFVEVGSVVDEDTDVCIIEAMKVFNNIKAECRGTIARILVTNGQTVEFGQVLFLVRPS